MPGLSDPLWTAEIPTGEVDTSDGCQVTIVLGTKSYKILIAAQIDAILRQLLCGWI
jgi:hypothetical protein